VAFSLNIPFYTIFAARLRSTTRHIAILLTALFTITFLPFNAFHHHQEDEHTAALLSHEKEHSCELDARFCQDSFIGECEHGSHISTTDVKCFSCQFHFIKTYAAATVYETAVISATPCQYYQKETSAVSVHIRNIYNKGPPASWC
jgi:hypothetical protein